MESSEAKNMSDIGHDSFHTEIVPRGFGEFGGIDTQVDKSGGGVGHGTDFEANWSCVSLNQLTYRHPYLADMSCIHSAI